MGIWVGGAEGDSLIPPPKLAARVRSPVQEYSGPKAADEEAVGGHRVVRVPPTPPHHWGPQLQDVVLQHVSPRVGDTGAGPQCVPRGGVLSPFRDGIPHPRRVPGSEMSSS